MLVTFPVLFYCRQRHRPELCLTFKVPSGRPSDEQPRSLPDLSRAQPPPSSVPRRPVPRWLHRGALTCCTCWQPRLPRELTSSAGCSELEGRQSPQTRHPQSEDGQFSYGQARRRCPLSRTSERPSMGNDTGCSFSSMLSNCHCQFWLMWGETVSLLFCLFLGCVTLHNFNIWLKPTLI